jgi:CheY-like chemotaxis protein
MSSYQLGKRLRELEGLQDLKLVAVTGYGQTTDHEISRTAGFFAHLVKPVKLDLLVQVLGLPNAEA